MKILAIESSCDDIGVAIYDDKYGLLFNKTCSQSKIHNKYGGVVPNIASDNHLLKIESIIKKSIKKSNIDIKSINYIACTSGPGLFGSLLIGVCVAKAISYSLNIPYYSINHLEGHLLSPLINCKIDIKKIFPFIGLIISGGNTLLIKSKKIGNYKIIGKTLDDNIGNVIDKIANLLKLKYPGGPEIYKISKFGISNYYNFPKPMINKKTLNMSFSGLKTHISKIIYKEKNINQNIKSNIALNLQETIIDILINKSKLAIKKFKIKNLFISGGVSSNIILRKKFIKYFKKLNINIIFPKKNFCTDNAAMIAHACMLNILNNKKYFNIKRELKIFVDPNWSIEKI